MSSKPRSFVLVTGAASGLGRCFAQHFVDQPGTTVVAVDIEPIALQGTPYCTGPMEYNSTDASDWFGLEVNFSDTTSVIDLVQTILNEGITKFDLILHSAGIRGLVDSVEQQRPNDVAAAEAIHAMNARTMLDTFKINTLGTFTLLQHLHDLDLFHPPALDGLQSPRSKVVIMTSRMGSISYNTTGGGYAYRASKAALNAIVKSMKIDLPEVIFALVHPGRVETGLTKCREEGAIEVEESVGEMLKTIDKLTLEDSARFMDRFGADIGW